MKIITNLMGEKKHTTLDALLNIPEIIDLFTFTIKHQTHRDFFEGYCLIMGVLFPLEDWHKETAGLHHVEILFPELELHCV